ncbi:hypothetical protein [Streptomyces sp. DB-54]
MCAALPDPLLRAAKVFLAGGDQGTPAFPDGACVVEPLDGASGGLRQVAHGGGDVDVVAEISARGDLAQAVDGGGQVFLRAAYGVVEGDRGLYERGEPGKAGNGDLGVQDGGASPRSSLPEIPLKELFGMFPLSRKALDISPQTITNGCPMVDRLSNLLTYAERGPRNLGVSSTKGARAMQLNRNRRGGLCLLPGYGSGALRGV